MDINTDLLIERYQQQYNQKNVDSIKDKKLKEAVNEFSSLLLKQMFKSMRETCPDEKLIDGGFSEDVFTDMLDKEISKIGSKQNSFSRLNRLLYQQLKEQN